MELIFEGIKKAFVLIFAGDRTILEILLLTIRVSGIAVIISMMLGIPLGFIVGLNNFKGKRILTAFINTGMGLPPVAAGLLIALLFWRSGPFGFMGLMYTPAVMIIAQVVIASPIIALRRKRRARTRAWLRRQGRGRGYRGSQASQGDGSA